MDVYVGNFRNLKTSLRGSAGQWSWLLRNQKRRGWNCGCQGADGRLAPRNIFAILAKKGETPWKSWNIPEFWRIIWWIMIQSGGFPYFLCLQPLLNTVDWFSSALCKCSMSWWNRVPGSALCQISWPGWKRAWWGPSWPVIHLNPIRFRIFRTPCNN